MAPRSGPGTQHSALSTRHSALAFWIPFTLAFFALRLPFLNAGYGADTDAYRVVLSGKYLWSTGEYLPSRLPGYPLHELATALLLWGGPFLTNLSTALAAFAGVLLFDRIVTALRVPHRWWLLVAVGFTPWLLVNSTITLDYHWALTAMLGAYLALIRRRPLLAGALLGVAAGFRLTALLFALPLLVLIVRQTWGWPARARDSGALIGGAAVLTITAYAPVLWVYGSRFWNFADSRVSPDVVIRMVGQQALGAVGALVTLGVLVGSWRELRRFPRLLNVNPHVLVWSLTVVIYGLIFLRLPMDAGYLIPIYPFAFLLVAKVLARWALPAIVVATLLSGVVDLDIQGLHNFSPTIAAREVRPSWRVAGFARDYRARTRWRDFAEDIPREPVPPQSVVLTLGAFPDVAVLWWDRLDYAIVERDLNAVSMLSDNGSLRGRERDVVYLAVSEPEVLRRLRGQGYSVYRAEPEGPAWRVRLLPVE